MRSVLEDKTTILKEDGSVREYRFNQGKGEMDWMYATGDRFQREGFRLILLELQNMWDRLDNLEKKLRGATSDGDSVDEPVEG